MSENRTICCDKCGRVILNNSKIVQIITGPLNAIAGLVHAGERGERVIYDVCPTCYDANNITYEITPRELGPESDR